MTPAARTLERRLGRGLAVALPALGAAMALGGGGYAPEIWLPWLVFAAGAVMVVALFGPGLRLERSRWILLGLFALQAVWTALSLLWAGDRAEAWEEANRTFLYLIAMVGAAAAVRWGGRRGPVWMVGGVLAAVGVTAAAILIRLGWGVGLDAAIQSGRLNYPVTYWNGLAALLMTGFWLAMGLASAPVHSRSAWWPRPLLLAAAVACCSLAVLPQSRGALWTFAFAVPLYVAVAPHRFRALVNLALVLAGVAAVWGPLTNVYQVGGGAGPVDPGAVAAAARAAAAWVLVAAGGVALAASLTWLVETRAGHFSRPWVTRIGVGLAVLALAGVVVGLVVLDSTVGGLGSYMSETWRQFTADRGPAAGTSSRFTDVGLNGRLQQWEIAVDAFAEQPAMGLGAQNYDIFFYQHRINQLQVRQPHSHPLGLLAELGAPGLALWLVFVVGVLTLGFRARLRTHSRRRRALLAGVLTAVVAWLVHSSADWLWQLAAVTWPVMLLMGGLLGLPDPAPTPGRAQAHDPARGEDRVLAPAPSGETLRPSSGRRFPWLGRAGIAAAAALILVSAALPWVSLSLARSGSAGSAAVALKLNPFSGLPAVSWAQSCQSAAQRSAASNDPAQEGAGATLDNLALAVDAWRTAIDRQPLKWNYCYLGGLAALAYVDAVEAVGGGAAAAPPGQAEGSLATTEALRAAAGGIRSGDPAVIEALGGEWLARSLSLNPLDAFVRQAYEAYEAR